MTEVNTVAGPFDRESAYETAQSLGNQYSVYGVERKDAEGYGTNVYDYFVEQDCSIVPDTIFGYASNEFLRKQYK